MPEPEKTTNNNPEIVLDQPTREISQTDRINKKLLTSLFKRLDEEAESPLNNTSDPDNNTTEDDEWKD